MSEVFTQNDYINAGRLQHKISHLRKLIESQRMSNERLCYRLEALNMVESIIDAQPKADVKRVRHGRWIDAQFVSGGGFNRCSECGCYIEKTYFANDYNVRYCPACGAKMDLRSPTEVQLDEADSVMMGGADSGGIECIDCIKAALGENFMGFLIGNVIKYTYRYRHKNGAQDLEKARWYLDRAIKELTENAEK